MVPEIAFACLRGSSASSGSPAENENELNEDGKGNGLNGDGNGNEEEEEDGAGKGNGNGNEDLNTFIKTRMTWGRMRFRARRAVKPPSVFCALVDDAWASGCDVGCGSVHEEGGGSSPHGESNGEVSGEESGCELPEGGESSVDGMVIFGVSAGEMGRMDRFEAGLYSREEVVAEIFVRGGDGGEGERGEMKRCRVETYMWAGSADGLVPDGEGTGEGWSLEGFVMSAVGRALIVGGGG